MVIHMIKGLNADLSEQYGLSYAEAFHYIGLAGRTVPL